MKNKSKDYIIEMEESRTYAVRVRASTKKEALERLWDPEYVKCETPGFYNAPEVKRIRKARK